MKIAKITKIGEVENPIIKNNISIGTTKKGIFIEGPVVGKPFKLQPIRSGASIPFITSSVTKIIDESTFETYNTIYKLSFVD